MAYTNEQYLLDRRHIEDTVHKLWMLVDLKLPAAEFVERAVNEALAPQLHVDYTVLFGGGESKNVTAKEQAESWAAVLGNIDGMLHHTGAILPDLPVPDGDVQAPGFTVVQCKAMTALRRGESVTENGCLMEIGLERLGVKGNPWRIISLRVLHRAYGGFE